MERLSSLANVSGRIRNAERISRVERTGVEIARMHVKAGFGARAEPSRIPLRNSGQWRTWVMSGKR